MNHSAIEGFGIIARAAGAPITMVEPRDQGDISFEALKALVERSGFSITPRPASFENLLGVNGASALLPLKNGNVVVFAGVSDDEGKEQVLILDPNAKDQGRFAIDREIFENHRTEEAYFIEPGREIKERNKQAFLAAFKALCMIKRHYGLAFDHDEERLKRLCNPGKCFGAEDVAALAGQMGLNPSAARLSFDDLAGKQDIFPLVALLRDGGSLVVCGYDPDQGEATVLDPNSPDLDQTRHSRSELEAIWDGTAMLVRPERFPHASLRSFVRLARHHSLDFSVEDLAHRHALANKEPGLAQFVRIAGETGFEADYKTMRREDLACLAEVYPVLAQRKSGAMIILWGCDPETGQFTIYDPLQPGDVRREISGEDFAKDWTGRVVLLKPASGVAAEEPKFGLASFVSEIMRHRRALSEVGLAAVVIHIISLATPLFFQIVIDKVLVHHALSTLHVLGIGMMIALSFDALLTYIRNYLLLHSTSVIDMRLAMSTFRKLVGLPIDFFEHRASGVLIKHMQQPEKIREFLTGKLFRTMLDSLALVVYLPILFFYSVWLALVVLIFSLTIAAAILLAIRPFRKRLKELYMSEGERQSFLVETIQGINTVKSLTLEPVRQKGWDARSAVATGMRYRVGKISISIQAVMDLLQKLMILSIPWWGAQMVFDGAMSVGALVAFQMLAGRVSGPLVQMVSLIHQYQETALSVNMLGEVMNQKSEGKTGVRGVMPEISGKIEYRGVNFRYSPESAPALSDVSLSIRPGQIVGIVGRSGSGKSTLVRLAQGLYQPQEGDVWIDGANLRDIDLPYLRQKIGVVLQENFLFRGSVRENIALAKPDSTIEDIVRAAGMAAAHEFIEKLPDGYNSSLEENGSNLSGGQKQRLAIARALLKNPKLLILDEATSALDPESEAAIQKHIKMIAKGRTMLIVSHRLSMLMDADLIVVMDAGKIIGQGDHGALYNECGLYRDLWDTQHRRVMTGKE